MIAAHTPGPWVVNPIQLDQVATADAKWVVARVSFLGGPAVTIANARLISAAPDLLELHKKHMELMMEIAQEMKSPRLPLGATVAASVRMLAIAAKESLDAIAKATGGQS